MSTHRGAAEHNIRPWGVTGLIVTPNSTNQKYTVNLVPRPLSPGRIFNVPRICSTSARTIVIPRPLECAGSNPDGTPGPSSRTDSE
jgi:hypothetical protein